MGESCFYLISLVYGLGVLSHHIVSIGIYCVHQFCGLWVGVINMDVLSSSLNKQPRTADEGWSSILGV